MKILIIEDEVAAYERLCKLVLEVEPAVEIVGHIESIESGVLWLQSHPEPDLILSDIHLADGSSFMIFDRVKINCAIVFTTAYDEYALKAFKLNSIDYLLKPIEKEDLRAALYKFKNYSKSNPTSEQVHSVLTSLLHTKKSFKERFLVKMSDKLIPVPTREVSYFVSEDKYVFLYYRDKKYPVDYTLEELEGLLDPQCFFRLNRKITAQIDAIVKISQHLNGKLKVELDPPYLEEVYVSRERATEFKGWLDGHC